MKTVSCNTQKPKNIYKLLSQKYGVQESTVNTVMYVMGYDIAADKAAILRKVRPLLRRYSLFGYIAHEGSPEAKIMNNFAVAEGLIKSRKKMSEKEKQEARDAYYSCKTFLKEEGLCPCDPPVGALPYVRKALRNNYTAGQAFRLLKDFAPHAHREAAWVRIPEAAVHFDSNVHCTEMLPYLFPKIKEGGSK